MERSKQQRALSVARFLTNLQIGAKITKHNNQIGISTNDWFRKMIWATFCSNQQTVNQIIVQKPAWLDRLNGQLRNLWTEQLLRCPHNGSIVQILNWKLSMMNYVIIDSL